jgi:hypothetical protein
MSRSDSFTILEVPLLDLDAILAQIRSAVERLLPNLTRHEYPYSAETDKMLKSLYREVIKLSHTDLVPDLGPRLFALHQVVDASVNCSALLDQEWISIEDDRRTKDLLNAMTYLKLSAFCGYGPARHIWADLAKKHERLLYNAIDDFDLVGLHIKAYDVVDITTYHEFVVQDMRLLCEAFCEDPQYKLYMALKEAHIPWGQTGGSGGDGNVGTDKMVEFILEQLEGTN